MVGIQLKEMSHSCHLHKYLQLVLMLMFPMQEFLSDYKRYIQQINDFDNRLGTILNFAFQEPKGLESVFKVSIFVIFVFH